MYLLMWLMHGGPISGTVTPPGAALFGIFVASSYRLSAARLKLPPWERYPGS